MDPEGPSPASYEEASAPKKTRKFPAIHSSAHLLNAPQEHRQEGRGRRDAHCGQGPAGHGQVQRGEAIQASVAGCQ
eukprot:scaffold201967_cov19-Tisochrysis_lutea.AAC.1